MGMITEQIQCSSCAEGKQRTSEIKGISTTDWMHGSDAVWHQIASDTLPVEHAYTALHDLLQPLTAIYNNAQVGALLLQKEMIGKELQAVMADILTCSRLACAMVQKFRCNA